MSAWGTRDGCLLPPELAAGADLVPPCSESFLQAYLNMTQVAGIPVPERTVSSESLTRTRFRVILQNTAPGRQWITLVASALCNLHILSTLFQVSGLFCYSR